MAAVTILVEANFSGSTWTDITAYLESEVTISGGRQDELSQADPNQCSFTLDNRDGRFTPGKTTGAYYPNVKVGVPVRVTAGIDTATSRRFTGFVDSWQLTWDDDVPRVQVSATSVMARLGLLSERKSAIEEEILRDAASVYYPLSEPAGATQATDRSGNGNGTLVPAGSGSAVTFGATTGVYGGATGAQATSTVSSGQYLEAALAPTFAPYTVEAFFVSTSSSASQLIYAGDPTVTSNGFRITVSASTIQVDSGPFTTSLSYPSNVVTDGRLHHVAAVISGATVSVYLDGVLGGTGTAQTPTAATTVRVGPFSGIVANAAVAASALSATRIADHYAAGASGFQGETAGTRLARYAAWGKVASYAATATTPVAADEYSGASVVDLMHNLETTESGVLYDERDGTLTLKGRQARYTATTAVSFDVTAQQVESSFTPTTDRQGIANDVTVTTTSGSTNLVDAASQAAYGVARISIDTLASEAQDPSARAQWEIAAHSTPKERVPSLGVDVLNCGLSPSTLLALTVGSRVAVTNPPSQAAGPGDYFIEGWSETFDPTSYMATFNVSPAQPWVNTFVLEDPTRGVLDSSFVLAY